MKQQELNKLYKTYEKRFEDDFDKAIKEYWKKIEELNGTILICDWKEGSGEMFVDYLKSEGYTVLQNPEQEGSDSYGYVVFPP